MLPAGLPTYRGSQFAWHAAREYAEYHLRVVLDADLDRTALARLVDRNLFFQRLPRPAEPNTQAHKQTPDLGRARQPGFPSADALTRRCHCQWPIIHSVRCGTLGLLPQGRQTPQRKHDRQCCFRCGPPESEPPSVCATVALQCGTVHDASRVASCTLQRPRGAACRRALRCAALQRNPSAVLLSLGGPGG